MRVDAEENRQKIMAAAVETFMLRNRHAPLEAVARRAGLGIGTVYRHFPTRQNLIDALIEDWLGEVERTCDAVIAGSATPRVMLTRWLKAYVACLRRYPDCTPNLVADLDVPTSPARPLHEALFAGFDRILAACGPDIARRADVLMLCRLTGGVALTAEYSNLPDTETDRALKYLVDSVLGPELPMVPSPPSRRASSRA